MFTFMFCVVIIALFHATMRTKCVRIPIYIEKIYIFNITYTFCVNWVRSEEEGGKQRGLGSVVQDPTRLIIGEASNQYRENVNHEGGYDSVKEDVQHVEAYWVQAARQEVVESEIKRGANTY